MDEFETNQNVTIARLHKVRRLIAIIDEKVARVTDDGGPGVYDRWKLAADGARKFTDKQWEELGVLDALTKNPKRDLSTVQPPSPTTRRMVIEALDERLRIRRVIAGKPAMEAL